MDRPPFCAANVRQVARLRQLDLASDEEHREFVAFLKKHREPIWEAAVAGKDEYAIPTNDMVHWRFVLKQLEFLDFSVRLDPPVGSFSPERLIIRLT